MAEPVLRDNVERTRYELLVDGDVAGFITYRASDDVVAMTHAEVRPEHQNQGLGSALAKMALDDVRARGLRVAPRCPFVADYIEQHPEYRDLVHAGNSST